MSAQQIIAELSKLSQTEPRAIARQILTEEDAQTLAYCDTRANALFPMLNELKKARCREPVSLSRGDHRN